MVREKERETERERERSANFSCKLPKYLGNADVKF